MENEMLIKKHLDLLGHEVKDKVSDYEGVVISMSFDLYGCIQADVWPKQLTKEDGSVRQGLWLDVSRLSKTSDAPLMEQPNFEWGEFAEGRKGPAHLPSKI
jgi:hypothetical protein